ncbi:ZGRF1 protein, partial [Nycticryphes semicollaris]|nr:ZGRF1 protein [Nycticryphes semicollaris]
ILFQHFIHLKQVLYTHQKMKKSKTWQDGILKIRTGGNKATLFDDKGQCLESIFIKSQVNAGDNLESERYLITVEAVNVNEKSVDDQPKKAETPAVDRNGVKPGVLPPRHLSVGLKRKFTGFQGPRQVEKKIPTTEDGENPTIMPLSKQCQGTLPSNFYITSPLFSTICKKDTKPNLSTDFHEGACTDNDTEHMFLSSLLSAPVLDRREETEKQNSDWSVVKSESSLITGHVTSCSQAAGHRAVSHNIRSTAQILALLKSKPTEGCKEETASEVTECLSTFQASENTGSLYNHNGTILPAFSGNPAKRLIRNIQHSPFAKETVSDKKEWNAEVLLNSAEQPCDKEVTGQRCGKKSNNVSQGLKDPCNTNTCFLPDSTISRISDSEFVPSSGDVLRSASPTTFEESLSRYREHSVSLEENSPVKLQSEFQLRQSSEAEPGSPELSVGAILSEIGIGGDVAQNAALRLRSCCEVVTHSKNQAVQCSTFDGEIDGSRSTAGIPSQLSDNNVTGRGRIAEGSANQTRIEVELLDDRHNVKEINGSQLNIEATNNKKDPDGCAAHTINGVSWIKSKHSDLLPGDANGNECHPKTSMFEKTESISCISTSREISAMDKRIDKDVIQLGYNKSPDTDLEHFWGTKSDDIKPGGPLLVLSQKSDPSSGSFQYIVEDHKKVFGISSKKDTLISRSSIYPLRKDHSSPEETPVGETEFENVETINAFHETCKGERIGMDCLKSTALAENSSDLHDLVNNIALLRALTQHSTALESLQKMEENSSILYE